MIFFMADYLITGAAGFIGFHTARNLKNGIGLDNFNDYYNPRLKRDRAEILKKEGFEVIEGDVCDQALLEKIIKEHKPKAIVHLAAQAGVRYSLKNPKSYLKSNIDGFLSILEIVRNNPHIKLIYASSSSVYGRNEKTPYAVSDRTDKQASLYGVTKKTNELMAETYHHLFGIHVCGLRFFTVYGPFGRPDMAYYSFSEAIRYGKEIELFNFGDCERDFTYIDDIVDGIISSLDVEGS
ncbi:MAG: NAD-dependent epimerase/dehydratase family protein, partial [Parachlamydiaceae bacterium]